MEKQLNVSAIKDGTVIDHIPTKALFKVIQILKLDEFKNMVELYRLLAAARDRNKTPK